jgi:hypothetical protein
MEAIFYLAAHTALVIATACFLWWAEARPFNLCVACNSDYLWVSILNPDFAKNPDGISKMTGLYPLNPLLFDYSAYSADDAKVPVTEMSPDVAISYGKYVSTINLAYSPHTTIMYYEKDC